MTFAVVSEPANSMPIICQYINIQAIEKTKNRSQTCPMASSLLIASSLLWICAVPENYGLDERGIYQKTDQERLKLWHASHFHPFQPKLLGQSFQILFAKY